MGAKIALGDEGGSRLTTLSHHVDVELFGSVKNQGDHHENQDPCESRTRRRDGREVRRRSNMVTERKGSTTNMAASRRCGEGAGPSSRIGNPPRERRREPRLQLWPGQRPRRSDGRNGRSDGPRKARDRMEDLRACERSAHPPNEPKMVRGGWGLFVRGAALDCPHAGDARAPHGESKPTLGQRGGLRESIHGTSNDHSSYGATVTKPSFS
jgi:hypothetical protein